MKPCCSAMKKDKSLAKSSKIIWKLPRNHKCHSFEISCEIYHFRCRSVIYFFLSAKREAISSRLSGHSLPRAGKAAHHLSSTVTDINALQRRLSGTSSAVFITTAACLMYISTTNKRVASLLRLFSLYESCSNNQMAAICHLHPCG